jgi:hypothetical protein
MNIPTKSLVVMASLIFSLGLAPVASAQTVRENRTELQNQWQNTKEQYQETKEQVKANVDAAKEQRCALATQRIELWTTRYANNQSLFQKTAQKSREVTDQVISRAKAAGKDTAQLETAVTTFQTKVDAASGEYNKLINLLNQTKQYACGNSEGQFKSSLQTARQQLVTTRQAVLDARLYYQQSVRPAAAALLKK